MDRVIMDPNKRYGRVVDIWIDTSTSMAAIAGRMRSHQAMQQAASRLLAEKLNAFVDELVSDWTSNGQKLDDLVIRVSYFNGTQFPGEFNIAEEVEKLTEQTYIEKRARGTSIRWSIIRHLPELKSAKAEMMALRGEFEEVFTSFALLTDGQESIHRDSLLRETRQIVDAARSEGTSYTLLVLDDGLLHDTYRKELLALGFAQDEIITSDHSEQGLIDGTQSMMTSMSIGVRRR